ncbi:MAG: acyl-CoA thioesterase [Sphingomonadales bacterium]|nr:acyl-CoA thioesterase [Sphingomonadales bacterium]PIX64929.1 MAG: acyl-CoA thioesterase [Sphingomonadales bacterium CG_4_10_14_3_um_filter_58_15]NCO48540.1 acyl-CoA thioesterase [Sphingomonadales bacterium]NCP00535.1 acyl-CoA thioesterase [Sphingomonadales bacterium]NCP25759.1 acyl-CoA thioesterase [Sphingomonadales bacterium]
MPTEGNPYGVAFGGWLMGQMAQAGGALAAKHSKHQSVVVGANDLRFGHPVGIGDELSVYAEFVKIGRSSMTVQVEAYRRDRHEDEMMKAASGVYIFVAVDGDGKPVQVPELALSSKSA